MPALGVWPAAVRHRLRWLSFKPFEENTPDGRSNERHRRIALSAAASALSKVLGMVTALVSIPLALGYLGAERFGIWSTLSSLMVALQFADLGIGNGLINRVAEAHGRGDREAIRRYLSSGLLALLVVAGLVGLLIPAAVFWVPWPQLLRLQDAVAIAEVGTAVAAFAACLALAIPLGVVQRVQIGLQRGFVASLWQCAANLLSLLAIWLATQWQLGLAWLVLALLAAPLLTALINGLWFFGVAERGLRPSPRVVTAPAVRQLLGTGGQFLVLQLAVAVLVYSDSLVIASVLGASHVATYAVPEKLFSIISVLLATLLIPLWPAYGEAIARQDTAWVRRTLKRSLWMATGVSMAGALLLVVGGPALMRLWVGDAVQVPWVLLVALGVWKVLEGAGLALAMYLNGAGIIRLQLVTACVTAAAALVAKPLMVQEWGVVGAPLATAAAYLAFTLLPLVLWLPRTWRQPRPPHPPAAGTAP